MLELDKLATERRNSASMDIDSLSTLDMVRLINSEDKKTVEAVEKILPQIAQAIDLTAKALSAGGRLIYVGAGTSGRLGVLDASECPPTFGVPPTLVSGLIAGGREAMFQAQEGAEDSPELGEQDLKNAQITSADVIVGISASGRTPYVVGALRYARSVGAAAVSVACSPDSPIAALADIALTALPGPEVITGSTRMKAGTTQKLILNMLSTGTMIKLGKVYGNLMVDVEETNEKLVARAHRIVVEATGCSSEESSAALSKASGSAKLAIFLILSGLPLENAKEELEKADGHLGLALKQYKRGDAK